jgi:phosphoribosylformylglycinamidine (FGAM) synthase-like enzyme
MPPSLGTTNNLNFGNPEKGHIAWQLTEAVRGLGDACRALRAPIVGGNVSLYNEAPSGPIYPTPVIGMVGLLGDAARAGRLGFQREGDVVALVGPFTPSLAASELSKLRGEPLPDGLEPIDVEAVAAAQEAVRCAVADGSVASAHDIAEGGLAVALAECCLAGSIGASIELAGGLWPAPGAGAAEAALVQILFGEGSGGFVVSGAEESLHGLGEDARVIAIGSVGGEALRIAGAGETLLEIALDELAQAHASLAALFA